MKLKLVVIFLIVAGLGIGFLLGRVQARYSLSTDLRRLEELSEAERSAREAVDFLRRVESPAAVKASAEFSTTLGMLLSLRSGNTNEVIEQLEDDLDLQVATIGAVLLDLPTGTKDPQLLSRIRGYRKYRALHPREDKTTLADHVLSLLSTNE